MLTLISPVLWLWPPTRFGGVGVGGGGAGARPVVDDEEDDDNLPKPGLGL